MVWESETPAFSLGLGAARESRRGARQERAEEEQGKREQRRSTVASLVLSSVKQHFVFLCFSSLYAFQRFPLTFIFIITP